MAKSDTYVTNREKANEGVGDDRFTHIFDTFRSTGPDLSRAPERIVRRHKAAGVLQVVNPLGVTVWSWEAARAAA